MRTRSAARRVAVSERRGGAALIVESEPIVPPAGRVMQLVAQLPEQVAGSARFLDLAPGQQAALSRFAQAGDLVAHPGHPERGLKIAQAALALFEMRFEQP